MKRIQYIKGKDLKQFFNDNFEEIQKEILTIMKLDLGKEANKESLQKFYQLNQQNNILHYLQKLPGDKAKYPKRLLPLQKGDNPNLETEFTDTGFYLLNIKTEKSSKPLIYLILLILLILFVVLFPIWPLNVKLGVLYFLMASLIFLIVFLISTIIISLVGILFGYDIYIMPNIDETKMSWKNRLFNPFILINSREDPCWFIAVRIIFLLGLIGLGVIAFFFPRIPVQSYNMMKKFLFWIFDYGKEKIEDIHYHRNAMKVKDGPYLDDIDNL
jgi:translocation protein SEC62